MTFSPSSVTFIVMKKTLFLTILALLSCNRSGNSDYMEVFGIGYSDRISYIVEGYQMHWAEGSPENLGLSYIYKYESPYGSFVQYDIDGDGVEELLMGDQFEDGSYQIYDIWTFDKKTGETLPLFCGGERDWCKICGDGVIVETGSNSASDSFTKFYSLRKLKLKELKRNLPKADTCLALQMDKFINYAKPQLCGGYTEQRDITEEEMELFRKVMEAAGASVEYTPLSVATQVVAGLNYRFWCRYDDKSEDSPAHCFITIYQPLQGDPEITKIDRQ